MSWVFYIFDTLNHISLRTIITKNIAHPSEFKNKLLQWAKPLREVVFLDSNNYEMKHSTFDMVLAVEAFTAIQTDHTHAFEDLHHYQSQTKDWLFGYLSYDLKNDIEQLASQNFDGLGFPELFFFQPKKIFTLQGEVLQLHYLNFCAEEIDEDLEAILSVKSEILGHQNQKFDIHQRISEVAYKEKVAEMLQHIYRGDIYEANFCMEFYAANVKLDPLHTFQKLNAISQTPFAVYFKNHQQYLMSASPERYLKKTGTTVISQPIKGTARRATDSIEDFQVKNALAEDPKERSENIMIVDLVRNDLSQVASKGSVAVEALCEVYTFAQVHQMISTITAQVAPSLPPVEIIKHTFPMGSMTGAPKVSAMQIIEKLEETKRGLYSGAVGYFTPHGDFDFNVVIRSILYNAENQYLSFSVGSAITAAATPAQEYQECLLKAKAMFEVVQ